MMNASPVSDIMVNFLVFDLRAEQAILNLNGSHGSVSRRPDASVPLRHLQMAYIAYIYIMGSY